MAADDVRDDELLWNELLGTVCGAGVDSIVTAQRVTAALRPVMDRLAREAAGKALRDAADDLENHGRFDVPVETLLRARAHAADGGTTT